MDPVLRSEASIERSCRDRAALAGFLLLKLHHGIVGMPDRLLVCPHAPDIFIEFKRPGERPEKIQEHWHDLLRGMGKRVEVVSSVARFRELLTEATEAAKMSAPGWSGQETKQ